MTGRAAAEKAKATALRLQQRHPSLRYEPYPTTSTAPKVPAAEKVLEEGEIDEEEGTNTNTNTNTSSPTSTIPRSLNPFKQRPTPPESPTTISHPVANKTITERPKPIQELCPNFTSTGTKQKAPSCPGLRPPGGPQLTPPRNLHLKLPLHARPSPRRHMSPPSPESPLYPTILQAIPHVEPPQCAQLRVLSNRILPVTLFLHLCAPGRCGHGVPLVRAVPETWVLLAWSGLSKNTPF